MRQSPEATERRARRTANRAAITHTRTTLPAACYSPVRRDVRSRKQFHSLEGCNLTRAVAQGLEGYGLTLTWAVSSLPWAVARIRAAWRGRAGRA